MRVGIDCRKVADYGIGTYIRGLLSGLVEIGGTDDYVLFAPAELHQLLPPDPRFVHASEASPGYSVRELFALGTAIRRHGLDVFHAPHYVVPLTDVPLVVTIHDLIHLKLPTWRRHPLAPLYARWMMGRTVRKSARIAVPSHAVRRDLEERYPTATEKIVVTAEGVDPTLRDAGRPEIPYGLAAGRYLLFVGNDKPHKNLDRLVHAYRQVRRDHPQIALALVGGTSRFEGEPGIICTGFVPAGDLAALYRGALALVQPSLEEGFGLPVLEAMSFGTPVLISSHPALVELAEEAAVVVDPRSIESIAAGLSRISADQLLREELGRKGRDRAARFSWRSCAESMREIYRAVANA